MLAEEFNTQRPRHTVASILRITGWDTLAGKDLSGFDLTDADLTNADLTNAVLTNAIMQGAIIDKVSLLEETDKWNGANLRDVQLVDKGKLLTKEESAPIIRQRMESLGFWEPQSVDNNAQTLEQ